jgi:hypothetical protein
MVKKGILRLIIDELLDSGGVIFYPLSHEWLGLRFAANHWI